MKAIIYVAVALAFLSLCVFTSGVVAGKAICGGMSDHDMRQQCYAMQSGKGQDCAGISDQDARELCRASASRRR